ncbi:MAG TPA: GYF domain-containing protein [Polyangiaceae bacterium]|jgi:hypothetical protein|nr:GYF domain-containing protein [Polyangiaceae bacterium]
MSKNLQGLADQWFVTNGVVAVGPVDFERLARGVAHGRIPTASFVRHQSWKVWRELREIGGLSAIDRLETVERLAGVSVVAEERAADPRSYPPPPLEVQTTPIDSVADSQPPLSSVRAAAVDPVGVLAAARDLEDALLLTLSTGVAAANSDAGLLHRDRPELGSIVTSYAHGPNAEVVLGSRLPEDDPSVIAARSGRTVMGDPQVGEIGRYIAGRLSPSLGMVRGVAMVPVVVFGQLVGMLEIGRTQTPFRAREVARVEDVIDALTARIVVQGWLELPDYGD